MSEDRVFYMEKFLGMMGVLTMSGAERAWEEVVTAHPSAHDREKDVFMAGYQHGLRDAARALEDSQGVTIEGED